MPRAYIPGSLNPRLKDGGGYAELEAWHVGRGTGVALSMPAFAGGASQHFSNALANSLEAIAHGTVGGFKPESSPAKYRLSP